MLRGERSGREIALEHLDSSTKVKLVLSQHRNRKYGNNIIIKAEPGVITIIYFALSTEQAFLPPNYLRARNNRGALLLLERLERSADAREGQSRNRIVFRELIPP